MKTVVLRVEDAALERFCGLVELCQDVKLVSIDGSDESQDVIDRCFAKAIRELQGRHVFKKSADYCYIMRAANDGAIFHSLFFVTPSDFLNYMEDLGLEKATGRSTLYNHINNIRGTYPRWTYYDADVISQAEMLRRNNIVAQFLSAFMREKRRLLDAQLDK